MDLIEDLNYDCNYNLFMTYYTMKKTIKSESDRRRVVEWVNKIMRSNKTLSDLRLRNDFLCYLAINVQNGDLRPPFDQEPRGTLKTLAKLLPGLDDNIGHDDEDYVLLRFLPAKHGGFLVPKPAPQVGAYCYLAAINN